MDSGRSLNILLAAEEAAGVQVLRMLLGGSHRIAAVLTTRPEGTVRGTTVWHMAESRQIPTRPAEQLRDPSFAGQIREWKVDLLLNIHSLYIARAAIVAAPGIGSFNLHPGPLPEYAGLNAPSWAIYRGETKHAVTLHWMVAKVDAGAIAYRTDFPIGDRDTGLTVSTRCVREGVALVRTLLEDAARDPDSIPRIPQDGTGRYFGREVPQDGRLNWSQPARQVAAFIRAASFHPLPSPWGHPWSKNGGEPVEFLRASATGEPTGARPGTVAVAGDRGVRIACADGWLLADLVRHGDRAVDPVELLSPGEVLGDDN